MHRNGKPHHHELLRSAKSGDRQARELLLVECLPLVRGVASRYRGAGLPFDDLVQEGSVGCSKPWTTSTRTWESSSTRTRASAAVAAAVGRVVEMIEEVLHDA